MADFGIRQGFFFVFVWSNFLGIHLCLTPLPFCLLRLTASFQLAL